MSNKETWKNRILGNDMVQADQLLANPGNWRIHPGAQQKALEAALDSVGWIQDVIVNQRSGYVIDGHLRVALAISKGELVPVKYVDLNEDEEKLVLATFDPITGMAATDADMLSELLAELRETPLVEEDAQLRALLGQVAGRELPFDHNEHWQGMPEFEQEDLTSVQKIIIHFRTFADVENFSLLIEQKLTDKTRAIWYPEAEKIDMSPVYIDES